jgi:hypothetical protein
MTRNKYAHIRSFKDFENEKVRLYFEIRLSEKKLQIKHLKMKAYINPIRFASILFHDFAQPILQFAKTTLMKYFEKKKNKYSKDEGVENTSSKPE